MTDTTISIGNRVKQWDARHHVEYIRSNRFKRYMGTGENAIIQLVEDLTKKKGDAVSINLVGALDASSGYNTGSVSLVGNEKALPNEGHPIRIGVVRDAVVVNVEEEQASPISIRNAGRVALKDLQMRYLRNDIINALSSINGVNFALATQTQRDIWLSNNTDRVLFGAAKANLSTTAPEAGATHDFSGSLAAVDATADKLTGDVVSLMKRMAQTASTANGDGIRPYTYGEDMETYTMFAPSFAFRDLRAWIISEGYWQDAERAGKENPLFSGPTSIYWDGVIVREIPEIGAIAGAGASGIDVAPVFLCGTQALGVAWGMRTKSTIRKEDDYEFKYGVGFMELRGVEKIQWGSGTATAKDWGVVTGFVSGEPDA